MDGPTLYNTTFNPIHSQYDWFVIFLLKSTYFLIFSQVLRAFLTIRKECSRKKSPISPLTHMKDQTLNLEKGQHRRGLINTVTWLCSGPTKFSHLVAIAEVGQVHQFDPQMIDGTGHYSINLGTLDKNVCKLHSLFNSPLCSIQNWLRLGCSIFFVLWYNHRSFDLRLVELHIVCLKFFFNTFVILHQTNAKQWAAHMPQVAQHQPEMQRTRFARFQKYPKFLYCFIPWLYYSRAFYVQL